MARTDVVGLPDGERIEDVDVSEEMQGSFLEYAYSVIYSRALPDARDGLKPVQRRILYQMAEMGLRPDRGHVKSARVTGEVMGKLHPHGDGAIYDALVRMAQPFTMRVPLVDGHGNFGSLDDGPAAARYTEARLAEPSMAMTEGLGEDVVDFVPNYDNQIMQPGVLPAAFPNLLVNGASGIAVGMATNMAPHNLGEVVEAAKHLLMNPQATLEELMEFVPGPDLPSGGTIVGLSGVRDAYATGRGSFRTRAKVSVENLTPRKVGLVVTELPYLVGPERVIEKIKDGVQSKKLVGISDVNDLTDRNHGLRLVIGIKSGFNPTAVLEQLYKHTPLEDGFGINNVALVGRVTAHPRAPRAARRLRAAPPRRRHPPVAVPAGTTQGTAAPGRGSAHRDPRHRRGHPGHPHLRRLRGGPQPPARRLRPLRGAGRVHPRAAPAPSDEVLADGARGRARPAARRHRRPRRTAGVRRTAPRAGRPRADRGVRQVRHPAPHAAHRGRRPGEGRSEGCGRPGVPADRRLPLPRAALDHRTAHPRRHPDVGARHRPRAEALEARRRPLRRGEHGAGADRRDHLDRAGPPALPRRRPRRAARRGPTRRRRPGHRLPGAHQGRDRRRRSSTCPARRRTRWRSAPHTAW